MPQHYPDTILSLENMYIDGWKPKGNALVLNIKK
jgi:hypothetical protein